jgi:ferredoxin/flavodoxin---NADP+ reductase
MPEASPEPPPNPAVEEPSADIAVPRASHIGAASYNARVEQIRSVHPALMIARVVPDAGVPEFEPGQYATLGLGAWEPRIGHTAGADALTAVVGDGPSVPRLIRRAYSISCPVLDDAGRLVTCSDLDFLEFYISLVSHTDDDPPRLTPRLFALGEGSRLFVSPRIRGTYTLGPLAGDETILLLATGTGEAPHNAMVAELLKHRHRGRILSAVCVRNRADLGYLSVHRELEQRYPQYRYLALTTREPENLDPGRPDFVGKQYLQDLLKSGQLEGILGGPLEPHRTHVWLCGNPDMIGLPPPARPAEPSFPAAGGMVELLTLRGFRLDRPETRGNIHFEKYW